MGKIQNVRRSYGNAILENLIVLLLNSQNDNERTNDTRDQCKNLIHPSKINIWSTVTEKANSWYVLHQGTATAKQDAYIR